MVSRARLISQLINATGDVKSDHLDNLPVQDSAAVVSIIPPATSVYSTLDSLPTSGLTSGDKALVESSGSGARLYISNGSGWYNVALINLLPTMTLDQSGTITLSTESLTSTVTITAVDSDNANLIYSVESDGNMLATGTTVSQDSSVFTIRGITEESGGVAGSFDLTFKVTDGIGIDTEALSFTLQYSLVVDSSSATVFLLKADGDNVDNSTLSYYDSANDSDDNSTFTRQGNIGNETVVAQRFSPYRNGGYSTHFNGGANDYLKVPNSTDFAFGTGAFTVECWFYATDLDHLGGALYPHLVSINSYTNGIYLRPKYDGTLYEVYVGNTQYTFSTTIEENEWTHVAVVRDGSGNLKLFENGIQIGTTQTGVTYDISTNTSGNYIGAGTHATSETFQGYIRDVRVVTSAVYTSNFTPPTEPLTAINGTELLACGLPYHGDQSINKFAIQHSTGAFPTVGSVSTQPFGPYDYEPWSSDNDIGSVLFGDGGEMYAAADTRFEFDSDFTIEFWAHHDTWAYGSPYIVDMTGYTGINHVYNKFRYHNGTIGASQVLYSTGASGTPYSWNHVAVCRSSGTTSIYANGVRGSSLADGHSWTLYSGRGPCLGGGHGGSDTFDFRGSMADVRLVNGTAVYTGATYTVPTSPLSIIPGTVLHMKNKTDANIRDATGGNQLKLEGDPKASTTQRKFSTSSSVYFDGTGDQIRIPDGVWKSFGTEDWTIEGWIYPTSGSSAYVWGDIASSGQNSTGSHFVLWSTTGITSYNYTTGNVTLTGSEATALNNWHHIATTREGNTFRLFVNGVLDASSTSTAAMNNSSVPYAIGGVGDYASLFTGYVQDFRITKGKARYTATFTPPTAEFEL